MKIKIYIKYSSRKFKLINKKINFKKISVNENYIATNEDLKFFKKYLKTNFLMTIF